MRNLSIEEFMKPTSSWNLNSATGPDKINNKILKALPKSWKSSKIIMILKKDKPAEHISSYRPISLINCLSKWLEKIINTKLQNWAEKHNILPLCQAGFRKNRSCQDQIFRITQQVTNGFNHKQLTRAIFFDLEKAFDKASHQGLLLRLKQHNLTKILFEWISNFLKNRTYFVEFN